jgi:hypothetical protein
VDAEKKLGARLRLEVPPKFSTFDPKLRLYTVFGIFAEMRSTLLIFFMGFVRYTENVLPYGKRLESLVREST